MGMDPGHPRVHSCSALSYTLKNTHSSQFVWRNSATHRSLTKPLKTRPAWPLNSIFSPILCNAVSLNNPLDVAAGASLQERMVILLSGKEFGRALVDTFCS